MAGERQSARIRSLYLEAVLKQDVSFVRAFIVSFAGEVKPVAGEVKSIERMGQGYLTYSLLLRAWLTN